ncbi:MAG: hypothetical protein AOA65_0823 [Candidatus Bathyarchaeota archaeon BA1]|nr:MAG: hypothetical protein AOA65_0823 [Candidatus Bathyarchaeota archaeon BA1]
MIPILMWIPWALIFLILMLCGFIMLIFLPALLELKRPKDPGPRRIAEPTIKKVVRHRRGPAKPIRWLPKSLRHTLIDLEGGESLELDVAVIRRIVDAGFPLDIEA